MKYRTAASYYLFSVIELFILSILFKAKLGIDTMLTSDL